MRATWLLLLGIVACKKTPAEAATVDAGSPVVTSAPALPSASAEPVVVDAGLPPLVAGHRRVWAGKGDPAARGCELGEDTGKLECSDDSFRRTTHRVPKATATAAIDRIVAREATCVPRVYPGGKRPPPGMYASGSVSDGTRADHLCDATTTLEELRALERTYR